MRTEKTIDLIYGFMVIDEDNNPIEGSWDYEPDEKILNESGITLVHFYSDFIPILGISESHTSMDPDTEYYFSIGQKLESKSEWKEVLKDFCSKNNIFFQDPEWIIGEGHHSVRRCYDDDYED